MLKASDLELIREGKGQFSLLVEGRRHLLSPEGFAKLCRLGNAYKHEVAPGLDTGPPYVVVASVPYLDVDDEQTTLAFNCPLAFSDRETAELAIPAIRAELEVMGFTADRGFYGSDEPEVALDNVPEDRFYPCDLNAFGDVASAVVYLRHSFATVSSHQLVEDWWESFGLKEGDNNAPEEAFRLVKTPREDE